jgi:hypothetical protein
MRKRTFSCSETLQSTESMSWKFNWMKQTQRWRWKKKFLFLSFFQTLTHRFRIFLEAVKVLARLYSSCLTTSSWFSRHLAADITFGFSTCGAKPQANPLIIINLLVNIEWLSREVRAFHITPYTCQNLQFSPPVSSKTILSAALCQMRLGSKDLMLLDHQACYKPLLDVCLFKDNVCFRIKDEKYISSSTTRTIGQGFQL